MFAFLIVIHSRLGVNSPANVLPQELFQHIYKFVKPKFVKPTIKGADNSKENWIQRGAVVARLGILEYQLFKREDIYHEKNQSDTGLSCNFYFFFIHHLFISCNGARSYSSSRRWKS